MTKEQSAALMDFTLWNSEFETFIYSRLVVLSYRCQPCFLNIKESLRLEKRASRNWEKEKKKKKEQKKKDKAISKYPMFH